MVGLVGLGRSGLLGFAGGLDALLLLPIQGRLHSVSQRGRELLRPSGDRLRGDADSGCSAFCSPAEKFDGLCFQHAHD